MLYHGSGSRGQSFRLVRQAFLQGDGLPFGDVLSEEEIQRAFESEDACFAQGGGDIYTPAITLWAFLPQVLHAGRLRSCTAAVSRVVVLRVALGRRPPSPAAGAGRRRRTPARTAGHGPNCPNGCSSGWSTTWPTSWSRGFLPTGFGTGVT